MPDFNHGKKKNIRCSLEKRPMTLGNLPTANMATGMDIRITNKMRMITASERQEKRSILCI